jgi:hypothetical protein
VRYGLFLCDTVGAGLPELDYLAAPALALLPVFERAVRLLESATDAQLVACVRAYLRHLASDKPAAKPSFAVELVWRTHLLQPRRYAEACAELRAGLADHSPAGTDAYADEVPAEREDAVPAPFERFTDGLVRALRRHEAFMKRLLAQPAVCTSALSMRAAATEYRDFIGLVKHSPTPLVPTLMVDLVWHTHMLFPRRYALECRSLTGSIVDHDDDVAGLLPEQNAVNDKETGAGS